jgi:3-deoxy-manno-octulosonate cytidylyltransferase (CMP-KDO synthetase)
MSICCVIPARFNSSRFPGKLLERALGKTVLQYTFEKALQCPEISHVFVATDDERIRDHILSLKGEVIWTSPNCPNGTERILEALQTHPVLQKSSFIVNLQGDHPCTEPSTLSAIIQSLLSDETASMATAVTPIENLSQFLSPHVVKCVFDTHHNALYFSRSPIPYSKKESLDRAYAHIGTYVYRTSFLNDFSRLKKSFYQECEDLEQLKVLENGNKIKIAIVKETVLGIDTKEDLEKLKEILCHHQNISLSQAELFPL